MSSRDIFDGLFVLEAANNHWGSVDRGLRLVKAYGEVVRHNDVTAAIKFQFRDVDAFIHESYKGAGERYIKKTMDTKLTRDEFETLINAVKQVGCVPMATPFDEKSVDLCEFFEMPFIKVASSDCNDWPLLEKIATTRKPVIVSLGGASQKAADDVYQFFTSRAIPLALNHCVSLYPSEDSELELAQIEYLKKRYPLAIIGFSTHEQYSWDASMYLSYALGARTWERHVDIEGDGKSVSPYCSVPSQIDTWFKAYHKSREMVGTAFEQRRSISKKEIVYLDNLVRGVYARRDLPQGYVISSSSFNDDFYMAIPLLKGQLSCRETMTGLTLKAPVKKDAPLNLASIDSIYDSDSIDAQVIAQRGNSPEDYI